MGTATLHHLIDRLSAVERGVGDRAETLSGLAVVKQLRSFVDAVEATLVWNLAELERAGQSESPVEALAAAGHRSNAEAKAAGKRAGVCAELPQFHDALAAGAISTAHVDALARVTGGLSDTGRSNLHERADGLLDAAKGMTVDAFARECAATARECSGDDGLSALERQRGLRAVARYVDRDSGMHITKLTLDPRTDEAMWAVINSTVRHRVASGQPTGQSWEHTAVDTVVELVTRGPATTGRVDVVRHRRTDPRPGDPARPGARPGHRARAGAGRVGVDVARPGPGARAGRAVRPRSAR